MKRFCRKICWVAYYYLNKGSFKHLAFTSEINKPYLITPKCVSIKDHVYIRKGCRIEGIFCYNDKYFNPEIVFDRGASVQQNLHLTCAQRIYIGKNTAIAANVTITDINHSYTDINIPIEHQDIHVKPVSIGNDCKIYNNAVILPGTKIGKHCVVGANSVVSGVYGDFSIIVGAPARVVKYYDAKEEKWIKKIS